MRFAIGLFSCLVIAGCGSGDKKLPAIKVVNVSGVVTLDSQPLQGAQVQFTPTGSTGNGAFGKTDENGKYTLGVGIKPGAEPGNYIVTIKWFATKDGKPAPTTEGIDMDQLIQAGTVVQKLPEKYSDSSKTELKADVKEGQDNDIPFELKSN